MRELKNSEIEAVSGGLMKQPIFEEASTAVVFKIAVSVLRFLSGRSVPIAKA